MNGRETHQTYCRICEALCGLEVDVEDGTVVDVRPDKQHPFTQGYCCVKGIAMGELHRDPDRLLYPEKRMPDGSFQPISWRQALAEIGEKTRRLRKRHGPHAVGLYFGNPVAFSYSHAIFMQALVRGLGTRNVFSAGSQDCNNKFVVGKELYGSAVIQPVPDFENTHYFLCLGSNPAISQMSFVHAPRPIERLKAIEKRGGKVVFVDPRRTESSEAGVGEHVFIRPDTDLFFLAALLHVFEREGWIWREGAQRYARGLDQVLEVARPFTPERAAQVTGIAAEKIEEIARGFATAPGAAAYCSTGVNQGTLGTLAYWLINAVNLASGNLDRAGGVMVTKGPIDTPRFMKRTNAEKSRARSRIGNFGQVLGTFPATILADEILTPGEGQIRAMFVGAGNPVLSCPGAERLQKAMSGLELLVTIDLFRNETGELAHYVLPTTDFFQREDFPLAFSSLQPVPFVQWTEAVAAPKGEQRQEWRIYRDLAQACGVPLFGTWPVDWLFRLSKALAKVPAVGERLELTPQRFLELGLRASPARLSELKKHPRGKFLPPNRPGSFLGKRVMTADGKVNLAPQAFLEEARQMESVWRQKTEEAADSGTLLLFSKRERFTHNSWMHNLPDFVKGERKGNYAYLNPVDAAARDIADKQLVRVRNDFGEIRLPARLTETVMAGAIAVPHGWGHQGAQGLRVASETSGVNVNALAPDGAERTERLAGMAHMNGVPVRVEPA